MVQLGTHILPHDKRFEDGVQSVDIDWVICVVAEKLEISFLTKEVCRRTAFCLSYARLCAINERIRICRLPIWKRL